MKTKRARAKTASVVRTTISLPRELHKKAEARAAAARRNFSNHIAVLIERDEEELQAATA